MADYRLVDATQLDSDLTTVADAIREKAGTSESLTFPDGMAAAVASISAGGGGGNFIEYATTFQFANLNLFGTSEVVVNALNAHHLGSAFSNSVAKNTTVKKITITTNKPCTNFNAAFYDSSGGSALEHIVLNVDTSQSPYYTSVFLNLSKLHTIDGTPLNPSNATSLNNSFGNCDALREVRFAPQSIKKAISFNRSQLLSADSITSIVNGLSPDTSGLTVTFAKNAVNTAFETAAGAADGSTSAAWLALIGTRSNWTISLV